MTKQTVSVKKPAIEEKITVSASLPIEGAQLAYAEQLVGVAIGPFVSKIVLGMDNSPNPPTPSIILVMPTNVLHLTAKHIIEVLSNPDMQEQLGNGFKNYQESVSHHRSTQEKQSVE